MSALYRMAFCNHDKVALGEKDLVVISASAIPGNEKMVDRIINELLRHGVTVWRNAMLEIHVSGHACQEEIKLMHALVRPKYFMPIHGEYKHMIAHKELAEYMGRSQKTFLFLISERFLKSIQKERVLTEVFRPAELW